MSNNNTNNDMAQPGFIAALQNDRKRWEVRAKEAEAERAEALKRVAELGRELDQVARDRAEARAEIVKLRNAAMLYNKPNPDVVARVQALFNAPPKGAK